MSKGMGILVTVLLSAAATGVWASLSDQGGGGTDDKKAVRDEGKRKVRARDSSPDAKTLAEVSTAPLALGDGPVHATFQPCSEREGAPALDITAHVRALRPGHHLYLVVRRLHAKAPPGVLYGVYLDLPPKPTRDQLKSHKVAALNFFDAILPKDDHDDGGANPRFVSFDVTDVVRSLQAEGLLKEKPTLTIIPAGKPAASAKPVIGAITLIER
jgi:hypothetical protein